MFPECRSFCAAGVSNLANFDYCKFKGDVLHQCIDFENGKMGLPGSKIVFGYGNFEGSDLRQTSILKLENMFAMRFLKSHGISTVSSFPMCHDVFSRFHGI